MEGAVEAVRRLPSLPRAKIRAVFERRFTAARMTRDYIGIYQKVTKTPSGRLDDIVGHPREAYHEVSQVYGA
jgi:hypothetical protein